MIIAMLFLLSFADTIVGMRRGRHTLGLSYCGLGWQFICWMATRFVVVNWDNHNNGVVNKAYDIPQRSKWGPAEGSDAWPLYVRMPDCAHVHAECVRLSCMYGTAMMPLVIPTALPNPEQPRFRCLEPALGLPHARTLGRRYAV